MKEGYKNAMKVIIKELQDDHSSYMAWRENIAVTFKKEMRNAGYFLTQEI